MAFTVKNDRRQERTAEEHGQGMPPECGHEACTVLAQADRSTWPAERRMSIVSGVVRGLVVLRAEEPEGPLHLTQQTLDTSYVDASTMWPYD